MALDHNGNFGPALLRRHICRLRAGRLYSEQRKHIQLSAGGHAGACDKVSPRRRYLRRYSTRAPKLGDIENVGFPDYDTGAASHYSYQSDELKIAVNKVEDDGVTYYVAEHMDAKC